MLSLLLFLSIQLPRQASPTCDAFVDECAAYLEHLESGSRASPDNIWRDLRYIATPDEAADWFAAESVQERRAFLEHFWGARAARAAVPPELRYGEHLRRLEWARRWYGRDFRYRLVGALGANEWYARLEPVLKPVTRPDSLYPVDLDDRGLIYMRFGAPNRVEHCGNPAVPMRVSEAGEIWVYSGSARAPGRLVMFATRGRSGDFQIVFGPGQTGCSDRQVAALKEMLALYDTRIQRAHLRDLFSERHRFTEEFSAISQLIYRPVGAGELSHEAAMLHDNETAARTITFQEHLGARYDERMEAAYEILAFRSAADTAHATVVTSVAIPLSALRRQSSARDGALRLRLGIVDEGGRGSLLTDTVASFVLPDAPASALAAFHAEEEIRPGAFSYMLRMEGGDAALDRIRPVDPDDPTSAPVRAGSGAVARGRLDVPSFAGPAISISSLAIGYVSRAPNTLQRYGTALSLVPTHVLPPDARTVVYYEIYGVEEDAHVQTRIEVKPHAGTEDGLVVRFDEQAAHVPGTTVVSVTRTLDFSQLTEGVHGVTVRIRVGDDEVARQTVVDLSSSPE